MSFVFGKSGRRRGRERRLVPRRELGHQEVDQGDGHDEKRLLGREKRRRRKARQKTPTRRRGKRRRDFETSLDGWGLDLMFCAVMAAASLAERGTEGHVGGFWLLSSSRRFSLLLLREVLMNEMKSMFSFYPNSLSLFTVIHPPFLPLLQDGVGEVMFGVY